MTKNNIKKLLKEVEGIKQYRDFSFDNSISENKTRGLFDPEKRLVEFSLSSEDPYQRSFGYEILGHKANEVDLKMLIGGPFLLEHNTSKFLGKIESARIENGRIIAVARFGRSALATEIFNDFVDELRGKISVGYFVKDMEEISEKSAVVPTFRVTSWVAIEASSVPIPADNTVGVGRSLEDKKAETEIALPLDAVETIKVEAKEVETVGNQTEIKIITEVRKMDPVTTNPVTSNVEVGKDNSQYVANMLKIGEKFGKSEMAKDFIIAKKSESDLAIAITELYESNPQAFHKAKGKPVDEVGLTQAEIKKWSIINYVNSWESQRSGNGSNIKSFEKDVSEQVEKQTGKRAQGIFMPLDIQINKSATRAMSIGTSSAGGYLQSTTLRPDMFIDVLRAADPSDQLGITVLNDLRGIYTIPRKTTAATMAWIAENGSAAESSAVFDLVTLTAKTISGNSIISREMRLQSSLDADALAMNELAAAIGNSRALAIFNGSGASNQPTGILLQSGINSVSPSANGDAPTHALLQQTIKECRTDNVSGVLKLVINAATQYALAVTPKVSAQDRYILDDMGKVNGMDVYITNHLPSNITKGSSGATLSKSITGLFSDCIVGYWGGLDILIDPYTYSNDGRVRINAFQDMDVQLRHPESFTVFADIITV